MGSPTNVYFEDTEEQLSTWGNFGEAKQGQIVKKQMEQLPKKFSEVKSYGSFGDSVVSCDFSFWKVS